MTGTLETLRAAMAPSGTLHAVINLGNSLLASLDADGKPVGVSVDLSRALADSLECPVSFVVVDAANKAVTALREEQADVGFFAIDPLRGEGIRFMVIEQAMGLPATRDSQAYDYLIAFVEKAKSSGNIAKYLTHHQIKGASVAPAA